MFILPVQLKIIPYVLLPFMHHILFQSTHVSGDGENLVKECEQIMLSKFSEMQGQLEVLCQEWSNLLDTIRQLEVISYLVFFLECLSLSCPVLGSFEYLKRTAGYLLVYYSHNIFTILNLVKDNIIFCKLLIVQ